jgi:serine/threonine protein kinase
LTFAQPFSGYEILAKIGSGAMGTVFKARQKKMGRIVALKVLRPSLARNERFVDRLRREARIVGSLSHPNIVAGYDLGEEGGYHFFVMELVEGDSLKQLLSEWGMFPEEQVLDVAIQVCEALDHAYQRGIIHRDIKPGNILIDEVNRVKLTDMGLAKGPTDVTLTRDGATVGTPQYISPEQARNPQDVDVRSDLYSFGATLFHMATGSPPFRGNSIGELITKVLSEREPWARDLNPLLSEGLNLVIRKLLAKDPERRYQNPAELLEDLRRVQRAEEPDVDPRHLEAVERTSPRWGTLSSLGALASTCLLLLWVLWPDSSDDTFSPSPNERFRSEMRDAVTGARSYRQKFAVLKRFEAKAENPIQARISQDRQADMNADLAQDLRDFIDGFLDEDRITWLEAPENWRDTRERFDDSLMRAIQEEFGYLPANLPAPARASIAPFMREQGRRIDNLVLRRDRRYLEEYVSYLQGDLSDEIDRRVAANDLLGAERVLNEIQLSFHGQNGRPRLDQLPDELIDAVERRRAQEIGEMRRFILLRRGSLSGRMRQEVAEDIKRLRQRLAAGTDPRRVLRDLNELSSELVLHYPGEEDFALLGENPWEEINAGIRRLDEEIRGELQFLEQDLLAEDLRQAYRSLLLEGEAWATIELLRNRSLSAEPLIEERARHVELLSQALGVRDEMFAELLQGRQSAFIAQQGGRRVELRQLPDQSYTLVSGGPEGERRFQLVYLDIEGLLRSLGSGFMTRIRAQSLGEGLAFWQFVSGQRRNAALQSLTEMSMRRFFSDQLRPLVEEIQGQASDLESSAAAALVRLRQAVENQELSLAQERLEEFQTSYAETQVARSNRRNLRQLSQWIDLEGRRQALRSAYQQSAPPGVSVEVDGDLRLRVDYPISALRALTLSENWRDESESLRLASEELGLERSFENALELPTLLAKDRSFELLLRFRLPGRDLRPRMFLLATERMWASLAVLPTADKAIAVLGSGNPATSLEMMRSEFTRMLDDFGSSTVALVPGGIHELRLRSEVRRSRVFVSLILEDREIARADYPVQDLDFSKLRLVPLQEMEVFGLFLQEL